MLLVSKLLLTATLIFPAAADTITPTVTPDELFRPNEKLTYQLRFIDNIAGECIIENLPPTVAEGRAAYHFRAFVRTIGSTGLILPYQQTVDIYFDREKFRPLFIDIHIKDRKKTQHTEIRLKNDELKGEEIEESTEPNRPPNKRYKGWAITPEAQSIFTILQTIRMRQLAAGTTLTFPVAHDQRTGVFHAEVVGTEEVRMPDGKRSATLLKVGREFTTTFYGNVKDEPRLWFSNDARRDLLKFEFLHRFGRVTAILKSR